MNPFFRLKTKYTKVNDIESRTDHLDTRAEQPGRAKPDARKDCGRNGQEEEEKREWKRTEEPKPMQKKEKRKRRKRCAKMAEDETAADKAPREAVALGRLKTRAAAGHVLLLVPSKRKMKKKNSRIETRHEIAQTQRPMASTTSDETAHGSVGSFSKLLLVFFYLVSSS